MPPGFRPACVIAFLLVCGVARTAAQSNFEQLLKQGEALSQRADWADAIPVLEKASQIVPQSYSANFLLGVDLLRSGRPKDAIVPLQTAAQANLQSPAPVFYLARAFTDAGNFASAAEAFVDLTHRSPESESSWASWADFDLERFRLLDLQLRSSQRSMAVVLRITAETLRGEGADENQRREDLLERSALAGPGQSGIWGELGCAQLRIGLQNKAAISLSTAQQQQPQDLWTLRLAARLAASQGDWQQAETQLLEIGDRSVGVLRQELQSWPADLLPGEGAFGEIWNCARSRSAECLAKIRFSASDTEDADKLFVEQRWEQLAALSPPNIENAHAWFQRGVAQAALNDCAHAIPALERGLGSGAETAAYWLELCYASEAVRSVDRLAALGYQTSVHRLRGDILVRVRGDPKAAIQEYLEAVRLDPKQPGFLERLAQAYFASGDFSRARQTGLRVLSLDSSRPQTLFLLASLAMKERDYPGAIEFLLKLQSLNPKSLWTMAQMGIAYAQTDRPTEAVQDLQLALAGGYPDESGALHAVLAGALRKLGRFQEAQRAADDAQRLANRFEQGAQDGSNDHQ